MADDKTINLLIKMGLDKTEAEKVRKGVKSVDDAIKDLDKSTAKLSGSMASLTKSLVAAGVAYQASNWAKDFAIDSYKAAASAERLGTATDTLGRRFSVSGQQIVDSIQKASRGTISELDAMKAANQAMLLNVVQSEEQFGQLAEMAVVLGRAMGQDAGKSIEDITVGIGRQSRLILDNLGIIVDAETAYQNYADSIGKSKDQLSDQEKQIAFTNEVMRQGQNAVNELGGVTDDTAAATERLTASWSDFNVAFGELLSDAGALDALNGVIQNLIDGAKAWSEVFEQADNIVNARRATTAAQGGEGIGTRLRRGSFRGTASILTGGLSNLAPGAVDYLFDLEQGVEGAILGNQELAQSYQEIVEAQDEAKNSGKQMADVVTAATEELTIAEEDYTKALEKTKEAQADLDTDYRRKIVDAETDNLRDIAALEEKFSQERLDIALDFEREMADIARDLAQERVDIAEDAAREIADIERKFAQEYADAGQDYRRDVVQIDRDLADNRLSIERDYQQRLADIRREFEQSAEEAVRNNDAIAFLRAQRQRDNSIEEAQTDRTRQLEEAQITAQQRREQLRQDRENELADLRVALERELEEQRTNTARKLADAQIGSNRKIEEARRAYAQELQDQTTAETRKRAALQTAYQQQLTDLQQYYNRRLVDTRNSLQAEYQMIAQYTAQMRQARSAGISSAGGANYSGMTAAQAAAYGAAYQRRGVGGYAGAGLYQLGESGSEYVMNAAITRQMEQALGGRITSGGLSALANRNMSMSNTFNFSERDDSRMILAQVDRIVTSKLTQLERGY